VDGGSITVSSEGRLSDSPLVEFIWRTRSDRPSTFMSVASPHSEIVVMKHNGKTMLTVRGPETHASPAPMLENAEFFGIVLKLGAFMPHLPTKSILNRQDVTLPEFTNQSFWLLGSAWQFPTYENADSFIDKLMREELLVRDPVVEAVLQGRLKDLSLRSVQRRFLHATGVTQGIVLQIQRAQKAIALLHQGRSILDTVYEAAYADQPHLTRSLKRFMGQTPAQILPPHQSE